MLVSEPAIFAALGDPTRLQIVSRLSDGEACPISQLTTMTSMSRQAMTKHLKLLENAGLVNNHRIGRESRFTLNPEGFRQVQEYIRTIEAQWDKALGRLRDHVES